MDGRRERGAAREVARATWGRLLSHRTGGASTQPMQAAPPAGPSQPASSKPPRPIDTAQPPVLVSPTDRTPPNGLLSPKGKKPVEVAAFKSPTSSHLPPPVTAGSPKHETPTATRQTGTAQVQMSKAEVRGSHRPSTSPSGPGYLPISNSEQTQSLTSVTLPQKINAWWRRLASSAGSTQLGTLLILVLLGLLTFSWVFTLRTSSRASSGAWAPGSCGADGIDKIPLPNGVDKITFIGHRGNSASFPENTLPSLQNGAEQVNFVEFDLACSKDRKVILMHDDTVDRTTNGTGTICKLNYDGYLEHLRVHGRDDDDESLDGLPRVPLLADALALLAESNSSMILDIKPCASSCPRSCEGFVNQIVEIVHDAGISSDKTIFTSTDRKLLAEVRDLVEKGVRLMPVIGMEMEKASPAELLSVLKPFDAVNIEDNLVLKRPDLVAAVQESFSSYDDLARQVYVWTVNDVEEARSLICHGVTLLITDKPDAFAAELAGNHTSRRL